MKSLFFIISKACKHSIQQPYIREAEAYILLLFINRLIIQ